MNLFNILIAIAAIVAPLAAALASYYTFKLNKVRIQFEENAKNIQHKQNILLQNVNDFSQQLMTQTLKVTPQYAFLPYQHTFPQITPSDISLFDLRRSHFTPEKEILTQKIVEILRSEILKDETLNIILILDAGSTVFPIFRQLCTHPTFQFDRKNASRLKIITNNLPGVSELTKYGRIGERKVARTLFRCRILSGYAHSEYEASLGPQTSSDLRSAIEELRQSNLEPKENNIKIVSVTTGNYVSLVDGILARHKHHIDIKSAMLAEADTTYVLAPLGKFLPYSLDEINNLLDLENEEKYDSLKTWKQYVNRVYMVITTRKPEYFRQLEPVELNAYFASIQKQIFDLFEEEFLITIPFDPMDDIRVRTQASILGPERTLREHELPHQDLRTNLINKLERGYSRRT